MDGMTNDRQKKRSACAMTRDQRRAVKNLATSVKRNVIKEKVDDLVGRAV